MPCSEKIIVTGATGIIGRHTLKAFAASGMEVYALTLSGAAQQSGVKNIKCDIFDAQSLEAVFKTVRPQYLLHLAWATTGDYLTSEVNLKFLEASLVMLQYFKQYGGRHFACAGTCFEYAFKDTPLKEEDPLFPQTLYAKCKNELRVQAQAFCTQNDITFAWGRVFYVLGGGEHKSRFTPYIINNLKENKEVSVKYGQLVRDYIYTKDIAQAFVKLTLLKAQGIFNICSAQGVSLKDYALLIAQKLGKTQLVKVFNEPTAQPLIITGDNQKLKRLTGFAPAYNLDAALEDILKDA